MACASSRSAPLMSPADDVTVHVRGDPPAAYRGVATLRGSTLKPTTRNRLRRT